MARQDSGRHKARRPGKKTSRWWFLLVVVVGLALGMLAGYYVHHYWPKPKPTGKVAAKEKAPAGAGTVKEVTSYSKPQAFDITRVNQTMAFLSSNIGARVAGRSGEKQAAAYLRAELEKLGYSVTVQDFTLPGGDPSENLVVSDPGSSGAYTFVVGAHIDTRYAAPGANDDASGCAGLLELARTMKNTRHVPEMRFVFFGAEEDNGSSGAARQGSQHYVNLLTPADRAKLVGMISMDMVSVSPEVHFRSWGGNSPAFADALTAAASAKGMIAMRDENQKSDHQPFGDAGIPAAWCERMLPGSKADGEMHSSGDNMAHVMPNLVVEVGDFLRGYLLALDEKTCKTLTTR